MRLFHAHRYDPSRWQVVATTEVAVRRCDGKVDKAGAELVYKNTCVECGDLAFRCVRSIDLREGRL